MKYSTVYAFFLSQLALLLPVAAQNANAYFGSGFGILGLIIFILDILAIVELLQGHGDMCEKLLWILFIIFFPLVGLIFYCFCARHRHHRHWGVGYVAV